MILSCSTEWLFTYGIMVLMNFSCWGAVKRRTYACLLPGDEVHINLRGASENSAVRLSRPTITMDPTYLTMSTQKQLTINNRSDVIVKFRWSAFATPQLEEQYRQKLVREKKTQFHNVGNYMVMSGATICAFGTWVIFFCYFSINANLHWFYFPVFDLAASIKIFNLLSAAILS